MYSEQFSSMMFSMLRYFDEGLIMRNNISSFFNFDWSIEIEMLLRKPYQNDLLLRVSSFLSHHIVKRVTHFFVSRMPFVEV